MEIISNYGVVLNRQKVQSARFPTIATLRHISKHLLSSLRFLVIPVKHWDVHMCFCLKDEEFWKFAKQNRNALQNDMVRELQTRLGNRQGGNPAEGYIRQASDRNLRESVSRDQMGINQIWENCFEKTQMLIQFDQFRE